VGFRLEFDQANQIFLIAFEGEIDERTVADCSAAVRRVGVAPLFTIIDNTGVTRADISSEQIRSAARRTPTKGVRQVIVAPQNVMYGLSRMFQIEGDEAWDDLHVVRTMREALDIIGVKSPSFSPIPINQRMTESDR
jgi:hypothetical protein